MSNPRSGIEYCDARSNVWSNVQFSTYNPLQVADFSNVKYFQQQPDSDSEDDVDDEGKNSFAKSLGPYSTFPATYLSCAFLTLPTSYRGHVHTKKKRTSDD